MFSSEQTFTINGDNNAYLSKVLQLALDISGCKEIKAFYEDKNGLVLCAYKIRMGSVPSAMVWRKWY